MERNPIEERTDLHDLVTGVYNLLFADGLTPAETQLYYIESESVEAEIELPSIGLNRAAWEHRWTAERKLEVLLHEFAHVDEGPDEPDHGDEFYARLTDLTAAAEAQRAELGALFGTELEFECVHDHVVESVNEYTVEPDVESVEQRKRSLREAFASADRADATQ